MTWDPHFLTRFKRLQTHLEKTGIDTAIVTDPKNVYYFTGYLNVSLTPLPTYLVAFKKGEPMLLTGNTETTAASKKFGGGIETFTNYDLRERMLAYPDLVATGIGTLTKSRRIHKVGVEFWHAPETVRQAVKGKGNSARLFDL